MGDQVLIDVLVIIVLTSLVQSIFGVGVLLFGTPLLLIADYRFVDALLVLLPVSSAINLMQIIKDRRKIDRLFIRNILIYTIPLVVLALVFVANNTINMSIIIGGFIVIISLSKIVRPINKIIEALFKRTRMYFIVMGIVHGLTNLGGSLLTAKIFHHDHDKLVKRSTIAAAYFMFALFQLITLAMIGESYSLSYLLYVVAGVVVYIVSENLIFVRIYDALYDRIFAVFLFVSGIVLIVKGVL